MGRELQKAQEGSRPPGSSGAPGAGRGYTWLMISPFSGTKTCTGAPSGDLRSTHTAGTCRGGDRGGGRAGLAGAGLVPRESHPTPALS